MIDQSDSHDQMVLGLSLNAEKSFQSFFVIKQNQLLVSTLEQAATENFADFIYLSGPKGFGKTHLLTSVQTAAISQGFTVLYIPLASFIEFDPTDVLAGHEGIDLVLVDDLELVANDCHWQQALFDTYNQRSELGRSMFFAANSPAQHLSSDILPDLKTRLGACLSFQLADFNDEELAALLSFKSGQCGLELNDQCSQFILTRAGRSPAAIIEVIESVDKAQMASGRKVSIPFLKDLFSW